MESRVLEFNLLIRGMIKIFLLVVIFIGCWIPSDKELLNRDEYIDEYFYLVKDEYGRKNIEGKVLLHKSNGDSILIEPEKME